MSLLDSYLNIKNKVKLNDAIMDGVAKAISKKAASDFQEIINSRSLNSATPIEHEENDNLDYISNSAEPLKLGTKRDFDTVMSTIKSFKNLEKKSNFIKTKELVESFFSKNLEDEAISSLKKELGVISVDSSFMSIIFQGLYFIVYSVFEQSAYKNNKRVIYGEDAVDLFVKVNYPSFGDWIQQAKSKYRDSDIFTNSYSENWLKFFYNNLNFDSNLPEEEIISKLMNVQQRLVDGFSNNMNAVLTEDCYQSNLAGTVAELTVEEREKEESKSNSLLLITVLATFFALVLYILIYQS